MFIIVSVGESSIRSLWRPGVVPFTGRVAAVTQHQKVPPAAPKVRNIIKMVFEKHCYSAQFSKSTAFGAFRTQLDLHFDKH